MGNETVSKPFRSLVIFSPASILDETGTALNKQGRIEVPKLDKKLGTFECPFREDAGSYYASLPWMTCSKMPSLVSNENDMCDLDAGSECRFIKRRRRNGPNHLEG